MWTSGKSRVVEEDPPGCVRLYHVKEGEGPPLHHVTGKWKDLMVAPQPRRHADALWKPRIFGACFYKMVSTRQSTRRSTRLQATAAAVSGTTDLPTRQATVLPAVHDAAPDKTEKDTSPTTLKKPGKRPLITSQAKPKNAKTKKAKVQAQAVSTGSNSLSSLPPEIMNLILDNINDKRTLSALVRTCKAFHSQLSHRLYRRIAVAAMFHAHISKLIRTLEPHLTIRQKKGLKKLGNYRGQQASYPTGLDEDQKPPCASHVKQFVIGVSTPGKKHQHIVDAYIQEALSTLDQLEVVETHLMTKLIADRIADLRHLKALALFSDNSTGDMSALGEIQNLKHLSVKDTGLPSPRNLREAVRSIIRQSMSTLESLSLHFSSLSANDMFVDRVDGQPGSPTLSVAAISPDKSPLKALKSLSISCYRIEPEAIVQLQRAFDFTKLVELSIGICRGVDPLFTHLTAIASSPFPRSVGMNLRHLSLSLRDSDENGTPDNQIGAALVARCLFIRAFDTLETLTLEDYGEFPENRGLANPGLAGALLEAISQHKNLKALRMPYRAIKSGLEIPYLSAANVRSIVDALPLLQEFEFAPDDSEMTEIGKSLSHAPHLSSVSCFPYKSWLTYPRDENHSFNVVSGIVKGFLDNMPTKSPSSSGTIAPGGNEAEGFVGTARVWEDVYKLKRVSPCQRNWDVASSFTVKPKKAKAASGPEQIWGADKAFSAWIRESPVAPVVRQHVGFDPEFAWVNKVQDEHGYA